MKNPLSISELTAQVNQILADGFGTVWVEGEISNPKSYPSGHVYLNLKDANAQMSAVIWKSIAARLRFEPHHGLQVLARGRVKIYPVRGTYQLEINELQPRGMGELELAFQQLKEKLERLGWFNPDRKRPLPRFPQRIGLVTSPAGAAIRDIVRILERRWPVAEVIVAPVAVQGEGAAAQIAEGIRKLNHYAAADVIITGRGGGSMEDLWAFNEEITARAIFESEIPVISAVGHEVDFTIADFVADHRAATPSEAAEITVPNREKIIDHLLSMQQRLSSRLTERVSLARQAWATLSQRQVFRQPMQFIRERAQLLDDLSVRQGRAARVNLDQAGQKLAASSARLEALSPLNVLKRGYSLTVKEMPEEKLTSNEDIVRSSEQVTVGERIETRLCQGRLVSRVEGVLD